VGGRCEQCVYLSYCFQIIAKKAIIQIDTNTSDHYPISMSFKWEHNKDDNLKIPNPKGKIKWGKTDKDLHRFMFVEVFVDITSYNDVMSMVVFQVYFMKLIYALLIFDLVLASINWHIHT
jgi:hypothetical protein